MKTNSQMDTLPDEILIRIFSYFPIEDRILCLERVCWRWRNLMPYSELARLDVNNMHRKLCHLGSSCQVEMNRRHQLGNRRSLKIWLEKIVESFVNRCGNVVQSLDLSGFSVDEKVGLMLQDFSRLEEVNISNCYFSSYASANLTKLRLKSLKLDGCDIDDCVLQQVTVDKLTLTSRFDYHFVPKMLTSLTVQSLTDADDLSAMVENCIKLTGFHLTHSHCISSAAIVAILASNYSGDQLTRLTLAIHPNVFDHVCAAFPNLTNLSLRAIKDRNFPTKIDAVSSLTKLERFQLHCRLLNEFSFTSTISKCRSLREVDVSAKRLMQMGVAIDASVSHLGVTKLKLSLDCVTATTRVASHFTRICPKLTSVKLMSPKVKQNYTTEHNVSSDSFCVEFNESVCGLRTLHCLTLPYLEAEESFEFVEYLSKSAVEKLAIYGGSFYFENNSTPKYKTYSNLNQLMLGPYFQSLTGLEAFLPYLVNLRRLSFHIDACTSSLLNVVGQLKELRLLELRSCGKYFLETLHIELIPFLKTRLDLKLADSYLRPLFVNVFMKHADGTTALSHKLAAEFVELSVRFKIY